MIILVTGPPAAGKSIVSEKLAEIIHRPAIISGDEISHFPRGVNSRPWESSEAENLFWKNVFSLIENFEQANYSIILDYVILRKWALEIKKQFPNSEIKYAILSAPIRVLLQRDSARPPAIQQESRIPIVHQQFEQDEFYHSFRIRAEELHLNLKAIAESILSEDRFYLSPISPAQFSGDFD